MARSTQRAAAAPDAEAHDALAQSTFARMLQIVRAAQTSMQTLEGHFGLSGAQLWALWQLSASPGMRVGELAASLFIQRSTASNLLDKLELRQLVRRERSGTDQRVVRLFLTPQGKEVMRRMPGPLFGKLRGAVQHLPEGALRGLLVGLESVLVQLANHSALHAPSTGGRGLAKGRR